MDSGRSSNVASPRLVAAYSQTKATVQRRLGPPGDPASFPSSPVLPLKRGSATGNGSRVPFLLRALHNPAANAERAAAHRRRPANGRARPPLSRYCRAAISGANMMMAEPQPARFSIEELLRSRHSILSTVLPPAKEEPKKAGVEQHPMLAGLALGAGLPGADQLPFWLSCAAASFPLEQGLLMAQRSGIALPCGISS